MVSSSRRRVLRAICGGASVGVVGGLAGCGGPTGVCTEPTPEPASPVPAADGPLEVEGVDWPMRYRDAGNTATIRRAGPTTDVVRRWTASPDLGAAGETWVVANGDRAYVAGRGGGAVVALDVSTGAVRWRNDGLRDTGSLAVDAAGDRLLVADADGLRAVLTTDGTRAWGPTGRSPAAADLVLVRDGTAYAAGAESIFAVDVASGEVRWTAPGTNLGAVADDRVFAGPGLRALSTADGRELWALEEPSPDGPVTVAGDDVYVGGPDTVAAFATADGTRRWRYRGGTERFRVPTISDDRLVVGTAHADGVGGNVYAVTREDGRRRWCANLGDRDVRVATGGGVAYLAAGDLLVARRVVDGEPIWSHGASGRRYRSLAVTRAGLLAAAEGGRVEAFGER